MIGAASRNDPVHPERLRIGQLDPRPAPVGLVDRVLRVDLHELRRVVVAEAHEVQVVERHEVAAVDDVGGVHGDLDDGHGRPRRGAEAHLVVAMGDLDVAEPHRVAPVVAQRVDGGGRVAHRPEAQPAGPDAGPHDEADLHEREGPTGDSGKRQPKKEANGGIDGCSDGGVRSRAPASSTSQLICRNSASGSSHVGAASADRWGRSVAGATSRVPKRGIESVLESRRRPA